MPTIVVLHYTAMDSADAAIDRLCDPEAEVSAHYVIDRYGSIARLVDEECRAWHAGSGEWRGLNDINSRSIGIELDNRGDHPFPEPQMAALEELLREICGRWEIAPENIIAHSDMAPGRKFDPGPRFDWARLARLGLAGPVVAPTCPQDFVSAAREAGYTANVDTDTLLMATRLRFAPWRDGGLREEDCILIHRV